MGSSARRPKSAAATTESKKFADIRLELGPEFALAIRRVARTGDGCLLLSHLFARHESDQGRPHDVMRDFPQYGRWWPTSVRELRQESGVSTPTIYNCLARFERAGFLERLQWSECGRPLLLIRLCADRLGQLMLATQSTKSFDFGRKESERGEA